MMMTGESCITLEVQGAR